MVSYSKKIIQLRKLGKTYKEIKEELGCAQSTISYHCKLNGLGGYSDRLTSDEKKQLQCLYDELGTINKVKEISGRSRDTIIRYVKTKKPKKSISNSQSVINWRKRTKLKLVEYMGGECQLCGYNKCVEALEFHHVNPAEKDFSISGKSLSFNRLKHEVDKCLMVCSNCHSEIHSGITKISL
jgi:uncharacterized protein YerC